MPAEEPHGKMEENKMAEEPLPLPGAEPPSNDNGDKPSDDKARPTEKTTSDHLSEEEENKLLADEDDLDVIDCYTEDFDSDMEQDFCKKEAMKEKDLKGKEKETNNRKDKVESNEQKEDNKEKTPEKVDPVLEDDDDEDVIQLCDDVSDMFLDGVSSTSVALPKPEISLRVKNEFEKERILSEPLVKQIVVPEVCVSDDEDDKASVGSQESLSLQIDHCVEKAAEVLSEVKKASAVAGGKSGAEGSAPTVKVRSTLNRSSSNGSDGGQGGCQQEDPDVLKLKLDLYQDMGGMDYEADDKMDESEKQLAVVRVKDEPSSPRSIIYLDDIPTIELTSTDEDAEPTPSQKQYKPAHSKKKKRSKKRKSKKKVVTEIVDLGMISSDDSFPILVDSTVSLVSRRTRNDSEGSEGTKPLRNRVLDIVKEEPDGGKKVKSLRRESIEVESIEPPVKKRKKTDPAMMGYRKRRKSVGRAASRASVISVSTATSSIPDEDIIVLSANEMLLADPGAIDGGGGISNIENGEPNDQVEPGDSKEELMHSLDLKESIGKELEQEVPLSHEAPLSQEKIEPAEESLFPVPTTDIALEDMLESFEEKDNKENKEPSVDNADKEPNDKPVVFHSMSTEEKFLMDSLFADCQKQVQLVPSQEHLESLNTIMDDGMPLVDPPNGTEPIAISYTICDGSAQPAIVHMQVDNVAPVEEPPTDIAKVPKAPHIKIIQNYQKYPFQAKPPKKQQTKTNNAPVPKRRGRKKREVKDESDEEYVPSSTRTRKRNPRSRKPKTDSTPPEPPAESIQEAEPVVEQLHQQDDKEEPPLNDHPEDPKPGDDDDDDGTATTSTACFNMPNLEEDLALTSSDEGETGAEATSKELVATSPSKVSCSSHAESAAPGTKLEDDQKKPNSGEPTVSKLTDMSGSKGKTAATSHKRGRPKGSTNKKISEFFHTDCKETTTKVEQSRKESTSQQSLSTKGSKPTMKSSQKRKRKRIISSSNSEETETTSMDTRTTTETELELQLAASSFESETEQTEQDENDLEKTRPAAADQMNNLQIVISPLTEDKIRQFNTPQKRNALAKACQTEISGLTWSIDLNQIDFSSDYFEKLRILLNSGTRRTASVRSFNGVDIPNRSNLQRSMDASSPPRPQPAQSNNRNSADTLLFQRAANPVEPRANNAEVPSARQKLERVVDGVRSTFRIPKLKKQPSTSPQAVTSSTPHLADSEDDLGVEALPSTSRSVDQPQQSNMTTSSSSRPPATSGVVQRMVVNDYVNDRGEYAENGNAVVTSRDRQEARLNIMMQDRFEAPNQNQNAGRESAPIANRMPASGAANGPPGTGQPILNQDPRPAALSMALENRSGLPNRAELLSVRRTIHNDVAQPQQQPQLVLPAIQQPIVQPFVPEVKYNPPPQANPFSMLGGYQPSSYAASSGSFNRGASASGYLNPGYDMMSMFSGDMMGMQQPQPRGNPNNINDFLTMLWDQFRQQQQPARPSLPILPPMQPSVAAAPLQSMPIQTGPSQLPAFNQLFPQMGQVAMQPSTTQAIEPQRTSEQTETISYIFGCVDFLSNRCIKTHCRYSHVLPRDEEVFQKLANQSRDNIMTTYRYVAGKDDLFGRYFPVFANVMGRNNMRHQLVSAIVDCEQAKRPIHYYKFIVDGLKLSGTSPVQAVQLLLEKHTKKNFHQINVLIELILETGEGIPTFLRMLEEFSNVRDYYYDVASVNRLLEFCVVSELPTNEMAIFVCKLMLRVPAGEEQQVDTRVLLEFIQKVRLDPAMALDVEDIVKKYGSVVMRP